MNRSRTLKAVFLEGFLVSVHSHMSPGGEEWSDYCGAVRRHGPRLQGALVYTLGGVPDSRQRKELHGVIRTTPSPPVALVSGSTCVGGVATSINWFLGEKALASFSPQELEQAVTYVTRGKASAKRHNALIHALSICADALDLQLPGVELHMLQREA